MNRLWRYFEEIVLEVMLDEDVITFASGWLGLCKYVMYSCINFCICLPDFENKGKNNTCAVLEQFVCHVAKTGKPTWVYHNQTRALFCVYMTCFFLCFLLRIPWSQFKPYFMFKLEKVMDDFHASAPEQRQQDNPNMDFVPFEEMKKRILKIVDSYIGWVNKFLAHH